MIMVGKSKVPYSNDSVTRNPNKTREAIVASLETGLGTERVGKWRREGFDFEPSGAQMPP